MFSCSICNHEEFYGVLFCSNCGARLFETSFSDTGKLYNTYPNQSNTNEKRQTTGSLGAATTTVGRVAIKVIDEDKTMRLPNKPEIIVGRSDQQRSMVPDVDMTDFNGQKLGVSRQHLAIRHDRTGVQVVDLGSANGTLLNGTLMKPNMHYLVNSGDEIQLGKLIVNILFDDDID